MNLQIGIDESGRGPWAGPVFASIVVLDEKQAEFLKEIGVTDSKKVGEKKRKLFFADIIKNSIYSKTKFFTAKQIDDMGIYIATQELIKQLVEEYFETDSSNLKSVVLIDGLFPKLILKTKSGANIGFQTVIQGDSKEVSISAASILSKIRRDEHMLKIHEKYPNYAFDKHKGYGTKLHAELLQKYGPCEEHRRSFKPVKKLIKN
jgi:ribonuclease HII